MKLKVQIAVSLLFIVISSVCAWAAEPNRTFTITLLPTEESRTGSNAKDPNAAKELLRIQKDPQKEIHLRFDLSGLPSGLKEDNFKRCVLRLVAKDVVFYPKGKPTTTTGGTDIRLRGWLANNDEKFSPTDDKNSILALSVLSQNNRVTLNANTSAAFRGAVYQKYLSQDKKISLRLLTNSNRASSLFYSTEAFGKTPSNKPRLVIEYTLPPPGLLETASWPQHQHNPEHTGGNPWIPFQAPKSFSLVPFLLPKIDGNVGTIADYPLIYQGNIYLISKVLKQNYLLSLDFKGAERWRHPIGEGTVQRSPVISRNGILYVVTENQTENQIARYDLTQSGKGYASYTLSGKLSDYTNLTQGNDGSLFLAMKENENNYIYGFTPSLKPFLKAGPFGTGQEKISTITVSPDGRKIFAQIPAGAVVIDVANPSEQTRITLTNNTDEPLEYYYVPVAGPADDIMIFSDFTSTANEGNIWGYSEKQRIWNASDTLLPQPVLGSDGRVYYIQGGALQGHAYNEVGMAEILCGDGCKAQATAEIANGAVTKINIVNGGERYKTPPVVTFVGRDSSKAQATAEIADGVVTKVNIVNGGQGYKNPPVVGFNVLNTTSNLVMDGANNMYFWDNGYLHGYSSEAEHLFNKVDLTKEKVETQRPAEPETISGEEKAVRNKESSGPEQFIRLMMGPDGTLWANNKNGNVLYAFKPSYASANLTLEQENIKTQTVYRDTGKLTVGGVTVSGGTQILLQGQNGIGFAPGFKVQKGASILARTGF